MAGIANQFKTMIFLAILTGLLLYVGSLFGSGGLVFAFIFVVLMNFGTYWFSDKIVLMMYGAKEMKGHPEVREMVREVTHKAGLPLPKMYLIESKNPNAFATGRDEHHAAVAFTTGILELLSKEELRGVVAHEVSHIKNKDILITTIAATIAGIISYLSQFAFMFGGRDDDGKGGNMISLLIIVVLAPIIAIILQLAISRSREYLADESGAKTIKDSHGLASALGKLERGVKAHPMQKGNEATASLFILNPFNARGLLGLFSTHPPIESRIARLREMKF